MSKSEVSVFLSLGTNVGQRENNLRSALDYISEFEDTRIIKVSGVYETKPWGYVEQDDFLNLCVYLITSLGPYELLYKCQQTEKKLHREKNFKWGPRTMDIDILMYDEVISDDETLTLPHPYMLERSFVMVPLVEIAPDLEIHGKKVEEWYRELDPGEKDNTLFVTLNPW